MGVENLWKIIEPLSTSKSLNMYALEHRQRADAAGETSARRKVLTLGVDMGTWIGECSAGALVSRSVHSAQSYPGGGLYIFFKRLTELTQMPISFVFVFDGPARQSIKRGHRVVHKPIWWERPAIAFIRAFGFAAHQAPGEAEAELAMFQEHGLIDGIISTDSDTCVFGGGVILKKTPDHCAVSDDQYDIYDVNSPSLKPGLPLSKGGSLLVALLCGGDYDDGIKGCGHATAFALARCGFGDMLREAFLAYDRPAFGRFLTLWRGQLRTELRHNHQGFLHGREPRLASKIVEPFPSYNTISSYVFPISSWTSGFHPPTNTDWTGLAPTIKDIARLCIEYFHWENPRTLKGKFEQYILKGLCLQMMHSSLLQHTRASKSLIMPNGMNITIIRLGYERRTGQYRRVYGPDLQPRMQASTTELVRMMGLSTGDVSSPADSIVFYPHQYFVHDVLHIAPTEAGSLRRPRKPRTTNQTKERHQYPRKGKKVGKGGAKKKRASVLLDRLDSDYYQHSQASAAASTSMQPANIRQPRRLEDVMDLSPLPCRNACKDVIDLTAACEEDVIDLTVAYDEDVIDLTV